MFSGKFQGDELVMVVRATRCRQPLVRYCVIDRVTRHVVALPSPNCTDCAVPLQVQTKLEAAQMKTAAPIERTLRAKVMPFDCNAELIDIAVERAPSIFNLTPSIHLGRASGNHSTQLQVLPRRLQDRFLLLEGGSLPLCQGGSGVISGLRKFQNRIIG